jgi:hypothetical protein
MKTIFHALMNQNIAPFFKTIGFETKDIHSETNQKLGVESFYFYKIEGDFNRNFYFESNFKNTDEMFFNWLCDHDDTWKQWKG